MKFASDWIGILFECSGLGLSLGNRQRAGWLSGFVGASFCGKGGGPLDNSQVVGGRGGLPRAQEIVLESIQCTMIRPYVLACAGH